MKVLFITRDMTGASLAGRLHHEGNDVRAFVSDPAFVEVLNGWIPKFESQETSLAWVGRDGLIVFDDSGLGELQDKLRADGFRVVGGCTGADKLEHDRIFAASVLNGAGIPTLTMHRFENAIEAARFLETDGGSWVLKRNGHDNPFSCYVARMPDSRDLISVLRQSPPPPHTHTQLQPDGI